MLKVLDVDNAIRCIGLDRPSKRNAIGVEMSLALEEVLTRTRHDSSIRTVIFHGEGASFSAGMDIKEFFDSSPWPIDELRQARAATEHWRIWLLREMPQTLISAVRGYCLGSALPFVAASDIVVAGRDAKFGLPEINFGLVPGGQIAQFAGTRLSRRGLAYAALTGRSLDAEQARRWGLVTQVVDGDPLQKALQIAKQMA
jgi:trans-feruloyl-CoA hydratase/vanillin synthase